MDAIKDIIPRVIGNWAQGQAPLTDIAQAWERSPAAGGTKAVDLKEGCLIVHVDCAARRVKLSANKNQYAQQLHAQYPQVKDIHFKVGKI